MISIFYNELNHPIIDVVIIFILMHGFYLVGSKTDIIHENWKYYKISIRSKVSKYYNRIKFFYFDFIYNNKFI